MADPILTEIAASLRELVAVNERGALATERLLKAMRETACSQHLPARVKMDWANGEAYLAIETERKRRASRG